MMKAARPAVQLGWPYDWLDVHGVLHGIRGTDAKVPVILQRHADEVGDGVLEFLRQLGGVGLPV
jgi:hypothetical protein